MRPCRARHKSTKKTESFTAVGCLIINNKIKNYEIKLLSYFSGPLGRGP